MVVCVKTSIYFNYQENSEISLNILLFLTIYIDKKYIYI